MRTRGLPSVDALLAELAEHGVADAPREAPDPDALRGLLDMAAFVAMHRKRVRFPDFHWDAPAFVAEDAKVTLRFAYARLPGAGEDALRWALGGSLDRLRDGRTLLALDARATGVKEFDLGHALYGQVTLFQFPHKPVESADPRVHDAQARGWTKVLKEHNLLPGRGIVVLDEHQGLLLRDERLADVVGFLVLFPTGHTSLWWNPFVRADANDPELQHWTAWGPGTGPPSAWREVLRVDEAQRPE